MAIELSSKKRDKTPLVVNIIGIVIISLIIISIATYLYFYLSNRSFVSRIQELDESAAQLNVTIKNEEINLLAIQKRINDYASLMSGHKNVLNVFNFIEENVLPSVWFTGFESGFDGNSMLLKGESPNYVLVEQQIGVFKKHDLVRNIELVELETNDQGRIEFSLNVSLHSKAFF